MSGIPRGWTRISADQIAHSSKRVRIRKVTFSASGGGHCYVVSYKKKKGRADNWYRHKTNPQDLSEAITLAEELV